MAERRHTQPHLTSSLVAHGPHNHTQVLRTQPEWASHAHNHAGAAPYSHNRSVQVGADLHKAGQTNQTEQIRQTLVSYTLVAIVQFLLQTRG